eukprot:3730508-Rhodomonas_salina.1
MASGFSSPRPDDAAQDIHGEQRDMWEQFDKGSGFLPGQGAIIDTSQHAREWERVKTPHVYKDNHGNKITMGLEQVKPFDITSVPFFAQS